MTEKLYYIGDQGPFYYDDSADTSEHMPRFVDLTTGLAAIEGTAILSTGPVTDGWVLTAVGDGTSAWEASGAALWTDAGAYYYPNNATGVHILDTGLVSISLAGGGADLLKVAATGAADNPTLRLENASGGLDIFAAGGTNAYLTGTTQGDSGIQYDSGEKFHIGVNGIAQFVLDETNLPGGGPETAYGGSAAPDIFMEARSVIIQSHTGAAYSEVAGGPWLTLRSRENFRDGVGAVINFETYNETNSTIICGVILNGGTVVGTAGHEQGDLDIIVMRDGTWSYIVIRGDSSAFYPGTNNIWDFGKTGERWKNIYAAGTVYSADFIASGNILATGYIGAGASGFTTTNATLSLSSNSGAKTMTFDSAGHLTLPGGGLFKNATADGNAAMLKARSENTVSFGWVSDKFHIWIDGSDQGYVTLT